MKCIFWAFFSGITAQHNGQWIFPFLSQSLYLIYSENTASNLRIAFCLSVFAINKKFQWVKVHWNSCYHCNLSVAKIFLLKKRTIASPFSLFPTIICLIAHLICLTLSDISLNITFLSSFLLWYSQTLLVYTFSYSLILCGSLFTLHVLSQLLCMLVVHSCLSLLFLCHKSKINILIPKLLSI